MLAPDAMPHLRRARVDPSMSAVLHELRPLHYAVGEDRANDRPGHVRAASAVRRWNGRLVLVQDDVNVLALRDVEGRVQPRLLPWGEGQRRVFDDTLGNKRAKLDLEAGLVLPDGRFLALGSGSTLRRDRVVVAWPDGRVELRDAAELYAALRSHTDFSGAELNLEGAAVVGDRVWLFQRGNGAPTATAQPIDATGALDLTAFVAWLDDRAPLPPPLCDVAQYDLGRVEGVRLGFTDAATLPDGRVAFLAVAEASPDAVRDGDVVACRFGVIDGEDVRTCDVTDPQGAAVRLKLEGLELEGLEPGEPEGSNGGPLRFVVVADMDRPDQPAVLGGLHVAWG
jgi:hypothetical protein